MEWPFLFVGADDADDFADAEVHVLFSREPDQSQRELIGEGAWEGAHLSATRDGAIASWLFEVHRICPIAVAFMHEGGEPSSWHTWSVHQTDRLLPVLEPILERGIDDGASHAARGILEMAQESGVFLPKRVHQLLDPGAPIRTALDTGDWRALIKHLDRQAKRAAGGASGDGSEGSARAGPDDRAIEILEAEFSARHPNHLRALLGAADALLSRDLSQDLTLALARAAVSLDGRTSMVGRGERILDRVRARAISDKEFADVLAYQAFEAIQRAQWLEAITTFELLLDSPDLDRTAYNNALYAVMADNNKLPVDRTRAERFLAAALRFGAENPSIFYNSACIYMELADVDKVLECLTLAREHGYEHAAKLRDEPMFRPIANDPRFIAIFADLGG